MKIVIFNDRWCSGGVESLWSNLLQYFDTEKFDVTVLVGQKETNVYDDKLKNNNIQLVSLMNTVISNPIKRNLKLMKLFKRFIIDNRIDIIHINSSNSICFKYAKISKSLDVPLICVHSHNTKIQNDKLKIKKLAHFFMRKKYFKYADIRFACSHMAGHFMYGKKSYRIINNGVDLNRFKYNLIARNNIRKQLGILDNTKVYIHIGRFSEQKNHIYLIDLFTEILKFDFNSKLLLIGEGELFYTVKEYINYKKINENVILLGVKKNVEDYLSASDVFILPSLHEGLPVVGIEAQASGIESYFSSEISSEIIINSNSSLFSLNEKIESIALNIIKTKKIYDRECGYTNLKSKGYSISEEAKKLQMLYEIKWKEKCNL